MAGPSTKVQFSQRYWAVRKRIQRLPKIGTEINDFQAKRLAIELINIFQEGIRNRSFRLEPLKQPTIQRKRDLGYKRPRTPLYGKGDEEDNSYINILGIRKLKGRGYRVAPRRAREHDADIKLEDLFQVHEFGATIAVTPKSRAFLHYIGIHLKKETTVIRIPPRPALFLATRRQLIRMRRRDPTPEVRKALTEFVNEGKDKLLKKIRKKTPDWDKYDEAIG